MEKEVISEIREFCTYSWCQFGTLFASNTNAMENNALFSHHYDERIWKNHYLGLLNHDCHRKEEEKIKLSTKLTRRMWKIV